MTEQVSAENTEFAEVLARALELRDQGRSDWLEEACRDHPTLRDGVLEHAEAAAEHSRVFQAALGHDPSVGVVLGERYRFEERLSLLS